MTPAGARLLVESAARFGVELRPEAIARLDRFLELLSLWNRRARLTGDREPEALLRKHVIDSLAVAPHLPGTGLVVDVGSGAGFPGLVVGCARPDLELRLIESRRRRASFLSEAIRTIALPHFLAGGYVQLREVRPVFVGDAIRDGRRFAGPGLAIE